MQHPPLPLNHSYSSQILLLYFFNSGVLLCPDLIFFFSLVWYYCSKGCDNILHHWLYTYDVFNFVQQWRPIRGFVL